MGKKKDSIIITGTAFWAKIVEPELNENTGKLEYKMDIGFLDEGTKSLLRSSGVPIKNKDQQLASQGKALQNDFVSCKSLFKPEIFNADLSSFPEGVLVGNGSKVVVRVTPYDWIYRSKSGTSLGLDAVQLIELVEFKKRTLDGFQAHTEGFKLGVEFQDEKDDDISFD
jgi:hypothetical protein